MHERTQRAIARLLFVFCCALPTAVTMFGVLVTWTPWYHQRVMRAIENEISRETGLIVRMEDYRRTAPGAMQLTNLRLVHPETLRPVATVREVEWVQRDKEVRVLLHQPELQSSQLKSAWQMVHDRFLCRPERTSQPVQFAANDLTIQSRTGSMTLRDVDAWLRPVGKTVEATIQCVPANNHADSIVTVTATRDRSQEPVTKWMLDTGAATLPCSALAEYLPALQTIGHEAEFQGTMHWHTGSDGWVVDLTGSRFEQIALDRVFSEQAHRLSGRATIELQRCRIDLANGQRDIVGSIRVAGGQIGRSMLLSAQQHLGFEVQFPEGVGDVPFDLMDVAFDINNARMQLTGICHRDPAFPTVGPGAVLCMNGYPLVRSTGRPLDSTAMLAASAADHAVLVPVSYQTGWLTNIFVPPSRPLPGGQSHIRSANQYNGGPTIKQPEKVVR